ncbi:Transcriptional regulator CRZ1 [Pseudozyma hubeiensis]|nr:Transcriptional regulator CRZ1 [Pseudozyma hubeiensis]
MCTSYFFLLREQQPSPLTPGSDTSTLFDFDLDPSDPSLELSKANALVSPTETLADQARPFERLDKSDLASRRLHYLERIEKVLSTELSPFDLFARNDAEQEHFKAARRHSFVAGARCNDAVPDSGVDMQNTGFGAQSHAHAAPGAQAQSNHEQYGSFYDPSSADGYSAPSHNTLLSAPSSSNPQSGFSHPSPSVSPAPGTQSGAPNTFRDFTLNPSPQSSPHLGSASHHRIGSHSSDAPSPSQYAQGMSSDPALAQTLGQIGQITLDEDQRYPPTFDDASDYGGSPAFSHPSAGPSTDGFVPSAYSSVPSQIPGHQASSKAPQLSLGIPTVSVSDTSMDYTPIAATLACSSDANMPSISVMAPSPSTPRAEGPHGHGAGFQNVLEQLLERAQTISAEVNDGSSQPASSANWLPSDPSTSLQTEPTSYTDASSTIVGTQAGSTLSQPSFVQGPFRPHSASGRIVPDGYSTEPTQMMSTLAGQPQRTPPVHAPGQWSSQAKRQDSYDKIRQFLRLDVDMGFQSTGKTESPTLASFRKRANSDIGPRSPVVAGNAEGAAGTAFDWSFAATSQAAAKPEPSGLDFDWSTIKADPAMLSNPGLPIDLSQPGTLDPSLLNNEQLQFDMMQAFADNGALLASMQQQQQQHVQQQQAMPPMFQLNGQGNTMPGIDYSSQLPQAGPNGFNAQWRFPGSGSQDAATNDAAGTTKLRRSNSARQSSPAGHRRLARSEDLSQSRMYQGADEDFLSQITAPNGGLAPPQTGRSVSSTSSAAGGHHHSISGSARVHPYRTGHDRHYSFGSNASSSSAGSASPLPQMAGGLVYDAAGNLVQYPSEGFGAMPGMGMDSNAAASPSASSVASGTSSQLAPPVPVVTSQATQVASASRRKSEALFACPIPGCGSTFTRQYNLRGHLRSHADERPYKCDWPGCDKSFARSHDCKRHQNLHLNIKPHTCEQCGKTFARLDALNRHHKSDTGGCNSESQSSSTDASSRSGGGDDAMESQPGSNSSNWGQSTVDAGGSQPSSKSFGGHVL